MFIIISNNISVTMLTNVKAEFCKVTKDEEQWNLNQETQKLEKRNAKREKPPPNAAKNTDNVRRNFTATLIILYGRNDNARKDKKELAESIIEWKNMERK